MLVVQHWGLGCPNPGLNRFKISIICLSFCYDIDKYPVYIWNLDTHDFIYYFTIFFICMNSDKFIGHEM